MLLQLAVVILFTVPLVQSVHVPPHHVRVFEPRLQSAPFASAPPSLPTITLVETLPVGNFSLASVLPQTFDVLLACTANATISIDLSAMYWNLLGTADRAVYSDDEMTRFGADRGRQLLQALHAAAARGVTLRVLTAKESIGAQALVQLPDELQQLVDAFPQRVHVRRWSGSDWYGGGILHQKLWLFDQRAVYIGSANMDWKSLAQVLEVGVVLQHLPLDAPLLIDCQRLFDVWWHWAALPIDTRLFDSMRFASKLQVPAWSLSLPLAQRSVDPFVAAHLTARGNMSHQLDVQFNTPSERPAHVFVAAAPLEATAGHSRTFDEDALLYTIQSATSSIKLSVMDFAPFSMYALTTHAGPIWWPALTNALLARVYATRGLVVQLLISEWQHTNKQLLPALALLLQHAALCKRMRSACAGSLTIKIFRVPGWQETIPTVGRPKPTWPPFTRVNHAKYIVSDTRANIGTSNMEWSYFYTTAGMSVNTDHEPTRAALEGVFDRNWHSSYAQELES